jgi:hypothetical protein
MENKKYFSEKIKKKCISQKTEDYLLTVFDTDEDLAYKKLFEFLTKLENSKK